MSEKTLPTPKQEAVVKTARKRYAAPRLEVYGSLQDLTRTSYTGIGADFGFYTNSAPG